MCTHRRVLLFGDVRDGAMHANDAGDMVRSVWDDIPGHYEGVATDAFQLMPNHVHGILVLRVAGTGTQQALPEDPTDTLGHTGPAGTCAVSLPSLVQRFKSLTTTRYAAGVRREGWPRFLHKLWQRNYYEHIIRDADELAGIRRYILENPMSWQYDRENPEHKKRDAQETWEV
jgi:REP element-mobilizing transposase RayT